MVDFIPDSDHNFSIDLDEGWLREDAAPLIAPFVGESKLNINMPDFKPLTFLKLFVKDEFIQSLVDQTNLYAERRLQTENTRVEYRYTKSVS
jgi:hypothetical protein